MFGEASRFVALKGKFLLFLFHNSIFSFFSVQGKALLLAATKRDASPNSEYITYEQLSLKLIVK
jgi:hypothetical protein